MALTLMPVHSYNLAGPHDNTCTRLHVHAYNPARSLQLLDVKPCRPTDRHEHTCIQACMHAHFISWTYNLARPLICMCIHASNPAHSLPTHGHTHIQPCTLTPTHGHTLIQPCMLTPTHECTLIQPCTLISTHGSTLIQPCTPTFAGR